jgi:hypothetical protein
MPTSNCGCDCSDCYSGGHCDRWPCRFAKPFLQRRSSDPGHVATTWHNAIQGCDSCELQRIQNWLHNHGIIASNQYWGPKTFADLLIEYLEQVTGRTA